MHRFMCVALLCSFTALAQAQDPAQLFSAIRQDDIKAVESLLRQGVDPNSRNQEGATALMYAALEAGLPVMKLLLANKADPNGQNSAGATALMWAAGDADKVRLLIEAGADVNAKSKLGRTALIIAATSAGNVETVRLLLAKGADPKLVDRNGDGPVGSAASAGDAAILRVVLANGGSTTELVRSGGIFRGYTPLTRAAQGTCLDCARLLLEHGASVNPVSDSPASIQAGLQSSGNFTPLLIAAPQGNAELVRTLLDHGASVDTRDSRGFTPLMLAVTGESQNAEIVRLLLAKGAKADVKATDGQSALSWAQKWGSDTEISRLIAQHGGKRDDLERQVAPTPEPSRRGAHEAAARAIALLQASHTTYFAKAGCAGCHHQLLSGLLIGAAREHGIPVDEKLGSELPKRLAAIKQPLREQLMERVSQGVSPIENSMFLLALASLGYPADTLTDALCHDLAGLQRVDGSWTALNQRPPIVYSPFSATAYVLRALQLYGSPGRRPEIERRIARAREWLVAVTPAHNEDRAMQLLGLHWSGADRALIRERAKPLIQLQQRDGGWSQRSGLPTDAYATGQALYTLHLAAGMPTTDPVFRHGMEYLLSTQHEDGSWFVRSRSVKFQPYFESGFPYGHDQWISAAGTNWAALALTLAAEKPSARSQ